MEFSPIEATPLMQTDVDLTPYNTLGVAARAAYFCEVDSEQGLVSALKWWKQQQHQLGIDLPIMPLGGGSNIVLAKNFPGLVIRICITGRDLLEENDDWLWIKVGAGESWHQWVEYCMGFHYWGLENLALIPGTVGAAPIQNIGAYGVELCNYFAELRAVEISSGVAVTFDVDACKFGYRDSVFKRQMRDKYIITSVTFKLRQAPSSYGDYPALQSYFHDLAIESPTPHQVFDAVCQIRSRKLPDPTDIANVGSFFKNPVVSDQQHEQLKAQCHSLVSYPVANGHKLAAGWLIEQAGWKGYREAEVGVHDQQALVLVNHNGSGEQILSLAEKIQVDIKERYQVELDIEPRVYAD